VRDCARCGAPLRYGHVLNAIAGAADPDDNGKDDGLVSCVCGAVHTPVAPFLLGLVFLGGSAAGAFGSLWLFADLLDRAIESWSSYWQGAALLAVFAVPSLLVMALVSLVWPLRFVEMRRRPREPAGPTAWRRGRLRAAHILRAGGRRGLLLDVAASARTETGAAAVLSAASGDASRHARLTPIDGSKAVA
jgi:hypothetical protein